MPKSVTMTTHAFRKPTIFISSTIYDFRDLRSSLKYYLEELGYVVNMSEFNDFRRDPDENSYEACLNTVKASDYFILLIGSRVGGLYSAAEQTTITQEEYRTAYNSAKEGKTRILVFVRSDVWTVKEDRGSLSKLLQSQYVANEELDADLAEKLSNHSSKFVTDADRIFAFINEVCRIDEMKTAVAGHGSLPPANWVHRFETFRDIVDALRVQLDVAGDLQTKVLIDSIKGELLDNLASISTKHKNGDIVPVTHWTKPFRTRYSLEFGEKVEVEYEHLRWIVFGSNSLYLPQKLLRWRAIDRCIDSGVFLKFDIASGALVRTDLHDALEKLRVRIEQYVACDLTGESLKLMQKYLPVTKHPGKVSVNSLDFGTVIIAANRLDDIKLLAETIYRRIDGQDVNFDTLTLQPLSPYSGQDELLSKEKVSASEIALSLLSPAGSVGPTK